MNFTWRIKGTGNEQYENNPSSPKPTVQNDQFRTIGIIHTLPKANRNCF
jgi:hypothetical protein